MKRITVSLKQDEIEFLRRIVGKGTRRAREIMRANILLLANMGKESKEIAEILGVNRSTVAQVKGRYVAGGLQNALKEKPRPGQPRKYTEKHEAEIIAMACASPPEGRKRWTIRLLMQEARKRPGFETINRESVRLILKKARLSLG
ncbi:MAG TPA: helix-turn-helix domain-containing protein [Desulfobacterales bacterium]|nr:helix-turn-helix domain-containing protein [Desulfobacterales bacterium]